MSKRTYNRISSGRKKKIIIAVIIIAVIFGIGKYLYSLRGTDVEIKADLSDAVIKLGEWDSENGRLELKALKPGVYNLEVSRKGFETFNAKAELVRGKKFKKQVSLSPLSFDFSFELIPKEAEYKLFFKDGSAREGKSSFQEKMPAGNIKIDLSLSGYNTSSRDFFLDEDSSLEFKLDKEGQLVHHIREIASGGSPKGAAFLPPDGKEIWVALLLGTSKAVNIFSASSGEKKGEINLGNHGGVEVIFNREGSRAYVSQMETDTVYEIDTKSREILRKFDTKSTWCKILELSPDEKTLYVSNWSGNNISEIDLEKGDLRRLIPTVGTPRGLYATKDGEYLFVGGIAKGELERIKLSDGESEIVYSVAGGGAVRHLAGDEEKGLLYFSDMANDKILTYNFKTGEVKKFADTDEKPNTIALSPDKKILYVSCRGENAEDDNYYLPGPEWGSVLLYDAETGKKLDAIVGGNQPTALAVSQDGRAMVFSNFLDNTLEFYEIPDYSILKNGNGGRSSVYKNDLKK